MFLDIHIQKIKSRFLDQNYIDSSNEKNICDFKYKGSSDSLTYKYFWSPFCNYLVNLTPKSLAPNLITTIGFIQVMITHLILVYFSPDFQQPVPGVFLFLCGLSTFLYQVLDNMDGKQARRTGSCTPLGMLFDHFLDSITTWIFGINQIICFGAGQRPIVVLIILVACYIAFYTAQWAQFHTGYLKLGKVNAVDEGLMFVQFLFFFTSFVGVEFWQQEFYGYTICEYSLAMFITITFNEIFQQIQNVFKSFEELKNNKSALDTQLPSLLLFGTGLILSVFSPIKIIEQDYYCYLFLITMGLIWSKTTLHLQIAHVAEDKKFNYMRKSFLGICLALILNTMSQFINTQKETIFNEKEVLILCFLVALVTFSHAVYSITKQMSEILNIQVFSLQYLQKNEQKKQKIQQALKNKST